MSGIYKEGEWYGRGGAEMPAEDMSEVASPMPGVMSRRFKYSTEEQVVGEWIDGKPVYQKIINIDDISHADISSTAFTLSGLANALKPKDVLYVGLMRNDGTHIPVVGYVDSSNYMILCSAGTMAYNSNYARYLIMQYTKNTD